MIRANADRIVRTILLGAEEVVWARLPIRYLPQRFVAKYATSWQDHSNAEFINRMKQRSMLHQETLTLLDYFARRACHGILEIGPYIGGGTAVIAKALKGVASKVPFISVEAGGAYDHPQLPSQDILADLRKTLDDNDVADRVTIIEGNSHDPQTAAEVGRALNGKKIDLLVIDSDGNVESDFALYGPMIADYAIVTCDDYVADSRLTQKPALIRPWLDKAVQSGLISPLGVYQWGTWFGRYLRQTEET